MSHSGEDVLYQLNSYLSVLGHFLSKITDYIQYVKSNNSFLMHANTTFNPMLRLRLINTLQYIIIK